MRLSKTKIKEDIFKELEENGFTVINPEVGNGYFLFDFGKNSVVHFQIKEIRGWKFGIWIRKDDEKNEFLVNLFGDKINWIDKFKPTAVPLTTEERLPYVYTKENKCSYSEPGLIVWHVMSKLQRLKKNRLIAEYGLSGTYDGFWEHLWSEFTYYDIQEPIEDFYEKSVVGKIYKVALWFLGLKYHKYIVVRDMIDGWTGKLKVYPRYDTGVEYRPGLPEETVKKIWYEIEDSWLVKFLNKHSNFSQYSDSEAKRGFYYPEYYEERRKKEDAKREKRLEKLKNKNNK